MRMPFVILPVFAVFLALFNTAASGGEAKEMDDSVFQIIKATPSKIWRLNKKTGEIAVCSLQGESMVCTTSSQAATPPIKTYEELEADRKQAREERLARDKEFLDKIIDSMKSAVQAVMEREASEQP